MTSLPIIGTSCQACGRFFPRWRVVTFAGGNARVCDYCWERHQKALAMFCGSIPPACQECGGSWEQNETEGKLTMRLYMKDGVYQLLCESCGDVFERKVDTFKDTPYGWRKKLKGSK